MSGSLPTIACMNSAWSIAHMKARRTAGLLNGGCKWFGRIISTPPVASWIATLIFAVLRSSGSRSLDGFSHQSCSLFCSAADLVPSSGMVVHITRSKWTILGPAVQSGVPLSRGLSLSNRS